MNLSFKKLNNQIKFVVREICQFKYRDQSELTAVYGGFGLSGLLLQGTKTTIFSPSTSMQVESFRLRPRSKN